MGLLDVSDLLLDPSFVQAATLIRRAATVNEYGETVLTETETCIQAAVQSGGNEVLQRLPQGARLSDTISVFYRGRLYAASPNGYADVLLWQGRRYLVQDIVEDYATYGAGYTQALCVLEATHV